MPTIIKEGSNHALRFLLVESLKDWYRDGEDNGKPVNKAVTGVFGALAGAVSVMVNQPVDVVKTRTQV